MKQQHADEPNEHTEHTLSEHQVSERDVAIIGLSCHFPAAPDAEAYWRLLESGTEAVRELSEDELRAAGVSAAEFSRPDYVRAASWIDGVEDFDADFFGYTPREAEILDPQQRLFLEHAWWALENAGVEPARFDGLIGVYAGVAWNTYLLSNLMSHRQLFDGGGAFQVFITNDKDFLPTRVSYKLDLKGPSVLVQTSCSTSLVASHLACLSLQNYECDLALVGGVTVKVPQRSGYYYMEGGLASPDGHCRSFDAEAAGTVFGSGVGVVALKRLTEALEDGDPIRAVIRGSAINNDGSVKVSYTAPSVEGQAEVIAAAQEMAGVEADTIRYVECHGTGTSLGDPIEVRALTKVFRASTEQQGFCALGSVKSNVGHLDAAAGVAGLIKTTLALEAQRIPPTVNFTMPNPALDLDSSPFYIAAQSEPWTPLGPADAPVPRRAGVSSFGVGGTNAHLILQEAPPQTAAWEEGQEEGPARPRQLVLLSARSAEALERAGANLRQRLTTGEIDSLDDLADVAYTLHTGRRTFSHRRAIVTRSVDQLAQQLLPAAEGGGGAGVTQAVDEDDPRSRPVAFLLPGQGSVHPGLLQGLLEDAADCPELVEALDRCAEILDGELDLMALLDPAIDGAELERTRHAQPLLFSVEYALARQWRAWGVEPDALLGHSVGEYVAACLAGVMELEDALTLVATRGRLMDELAEGGMLALPLDESETRQLVERLRQRGHDTLALAAVNEPGRCVVAGSAEALDALRAELATRGEAVDCRPLHTSHAFHSPMMQAAVEPFRQALAGIELHPPEIPFVSNLTGAWITDAEATDPEYWLRHMLQPVRFADGVATLLGDPARVLLEVGPGNALSTLARRHPARTPRQAVLHSLPHPRQISSQESLDDALSVLLAAYGGLWLAGLDLDGERLFEGQARRKRSLPGYPFERRRYWIESRWDEAATAGTSAVGSHASAAATLRPLDSLDQAFYVPSWRPAPQVSRTPSDRQSPSTWLLASTEGSFGLDALARELRDAGRTVTVRESGQAWRSLLETTTQDLALSEDADPPLSTGVELGIVLATQEPEVVVKLAAALTSWAGERPGAPIGVELVVLTQGAVLLPGEGGRQDFEPRTAALTGLLRVLPQEQPAVRCRLVDIALDLALDLDADVDSAVARRIVADLTSTETHAPQRTALRRSGRWMEAFEPVSLPESEAESEAQSEVQSEVQSEADAEAAQQRDALLVGPLEAEGYGVARLLASRLPEEGRLWLLQPASSDETRRRITELAASLADRGGTIEAHELDLTDATAIENVVRQASALDGFEGFDSVVLTQLVAASNLSSSQVELSTLSELAQGASGGGAGGRSLDDVLTPALTVAQAVDTAFDALVSSGTVATPASGAWVLTSLASLLGGLAYGARAATASALEAFVATRRNAGSQLPWNSVALDVWDVDVAGGDVASDDSAVRNSARSQLQLSSQQGEEVLRRLLKQARHAGGHSGDWLVTSADLDARRAQRRRTIDEHRALVLGHPRLDPSDPSSVLGDGSTARHARPDLPTPYAAPSSELERRIVEVWSGLLGFEQIGVDDNFFELGGDSFIAVQVTTRLQQALGVELPVARLYQGVTPRALARLLEGEEAQQEQRQERLEEKRETARDRRAFLEQRRRAKQR